MANTGKGGKRDSVALDDAIDTAAQDNLAERRNQLARDVVNPIVHDLSMIDVTSKPDQATRKLKELLSEIEGQTSGLGKISITDVVPDYDMEVISQAFDIIHQDYKDEMEEIVGDFDRVSSTNTLWYQSAFFVDEARADQRLRACTMWIKDQEAYLMERKVVYGKTIDNIKRIIGKINGEVSLESLSGGIE